MFLELIEFELKESKFGFVCGGFLLQIQKAIIDRQDCEM